MENENEERGEEKGEVGGYEDEKGKGKEEDGPSAMPDVDAVASVRERFGHSLEFISLPPDLAGSDRGRPGAPTAIEYTLYPLSSPSPPLHLPRVPLHPVLFLRGMSYISRYSGKGMHFAVPNIVIEYPMEVFLSSTATPPHLLADLPPSSSFRPSIRVWSYCDCPDIINVLSHPFVHLREERRKAVRYVAMGCYRPIGFSAPSSDPAPHQGKPHSKPHPHSSSHGQSQSHAD